MIEGSTDLHDKQGPDKCPCLEVPDFDKTVLTSSVQGVASNNKRENCAGVAVECVKEPRRASR